MTETITPVPTQIDQQLAWALIEKARTKGVDLVGGAACWPG